MKVILKNVRLSFPSLWNHSEYAGESSGKYEATFLIPEDDPQIQELKRAIKAVGEDKLGDGWQKAKICLKDGNQKTYSGYENHKFIKASNKNRFDIVDRDLHPITESDMLVKAGDYVNASVTIWAISGKYGKFIQAQLNSIQYVKEGEAFGVAAPRATDDFTALGDDSGMTTKASPDLSIDDDMDF
jgi:hypothetical protein